MNGADLRINIQSNDDNLSKEPILKLIIHLSLGIIFAYTTYQIKSIKSFSR